MLPHEHSLAELLAIDADRAQNAGELAESEDLYARAAELEALALKKVPSEKVRTQGILGVSVASLWYRAARYAKAEEVARQLLERDDLLPSTRQQLDEILSAIPREQSVASGGAILSFMPGGANTDRPLRNTRVLRELASVRDDAAREKELEERYLENRTLLMFVATKKFYVPERDAEALVQEVFASLAVTGTKVDNVRAWLVAATCNASRHYWRQRRTTNVLPEAVDDLRDSGATGLADSFASRLALRQALDYLQPRCRDILVLHYFEGRSAAEVARELEMTPRYAEKMIHNCLKRVREIYMSITRIASDRDQTPRPSSG